MPNPAPSGITGTACTLAAPHNANAVANKVAGFMARRKDAGVCEWLAGFIAGDPRRNVRTVWFGRSDGLAGDCGWWSFESAGTDRNHLEIPDAGRETGELITGRGRIRDHHALVEIRTVAAIPDAIPGEIVERFATHFRRRHFPLQ